MKNDANEKMFVLYQQLFDEFKKTNNKLLQILEVYPESHERMKNYIISVMRGRILVKKGV
ncbi:hypothetical protein [Staphylococcus aureus]|uniref:hypothetical protein n=1 Tax=Staphylococcus aureus TaxID=1280 RepID=UPI0030F3FD59